jgi:hypothetical protein
LLIAAQNLGQGHLPILNEDIIDMENTIDVVLDPPYDYLNWAVKDGLKENEHYVLLDRQCWELFDNYERYAVKRRMQKTNDGKKVEVFFRRVRSAGYSDECDMPLQRTTEER